MVPRVNHLPAPPPKTSWLRRLRDDWVLVVLITLALAGILLWPQIEKFTDEIWNLIS